MPYRRPFLKRKFSEIQDSLYSTALNSYIHLQPFRNAIIFLLNFDIEPLRPDKNIFFLKILSRLNLNSHLKHMLAYI